MDKNETRVISVKAGLLAGIAMLAMFALLPRANAGTILINFTGPKGNSGHARLSVKHDSIASSKYDPYTPNPSGARGNHDPEGAQIISGASGSFNDISITGVKARNGANPPPPETRPRSYSTVPPSLPYLASYDDLFYLYGAPIVCPPGQKHADGYKYPGGFLDIFGVMFTLADSSAPV